MESINNHHNMEWLPCTLCGSHLAVSHLNIQRLVRCLDCGLIYVNPRPVSSEVHAQYNAEYFHCKTPVRGGYENYLEDKREICLTFNRRLRKLQPLLPDCSGRRLLDVGCAAGFFLEEAKKNQWIVEGLEICESQAMEARKRGFDVSIGSVEDANFKEGSFDVITLWDVIEHLPDPATALKTLSKWLKPDGRLVLTTPDTSSWMALVFRRNWLGFRSVDEHLCFFSRDTMNKTLKTAGFKPVHFMHTGKYLHLPRIITRLRYYTRIGSALLRFSESKFPNTSVYLNPLDTMLVVAMKVQ